jgi:broad specificity phosphatase PhoE
LKPKGEINLKFAFLLALAALLFVVPQDDFKPMTVYLVRHAERADEPRQDPPLTEKGAMRSQELARVLRDANIKAVFTSQYLRTKQTAEPLAKQANAPVTSISLSVNPSNPRMVSEQSTAEVANKILERAGQNVLLVGHSNSIPDLIKMLGGDVAPVIDERVFDDVFVVTIYAKGKAKVAHLKYGSAEMGGRMDR